MEFEIKCEEVKLYENHHSISLYNIDKNSDMFIEVDLEFNTKRVDSSINPGQRFKLTLTAIEE